MLTKSIVVLYVLILEIALWLMLPLSSVWGYMSIVPIMHDMGAVPANEFAWRIVGALVFPAITFLFLAVIVGPFLILVDVRNAVRGIEARLAQAAEAKGSHYFQRKEPTL